MQAWSFAVALMVAVLGFEFLMFRYVGTGRTAAETGSTGTGAQRAGEATGPDANAKAAGAVVGEQSGGGTDPIQCPDCGARNSDLATVRYCRDCLGRLH